MKSIIKKIFFAVAFGFAVLVLAQEYPNDRYYDNSSGYEYYDQSYNYPDDYYYDYPDDYYTNDYYRGYYNDYRNTIVSINWDRFFVEFRLSPIQIREIRILNTRFSNYGNWYGYYRYNPDRWYYDRFFTLERILGPRIYLVFYQRYYHNYNPIVYFQNYRTRHYRPTVYVTQRYRNVDVRTFRNDNFRKGGFDNERRENVEKNKEDKGFRGNRGGEGGFVRENNNPNREWGNNQSEHSRGFRNEGEQLRNFGNQNSNNNPSRNDAFRGERPSRNENAARADGGFRKEQGNSNNRQQGNRGNRSFK